MLCACQDMLRACRDKETGKQRGFAFIAYEDQRSTVLAVDNLSGGRVGGRTIRVDHVDNYENQTRRGTRLTAVSPHRNFDVHGWRAAC